MNETLDFKIIKAIIRRRWKSFIISFLFIFIAGVATAVLLPAKYLSTSTILIENQMIPQEYVQTTITSFVEERLAAITQQIMSRTRLMEIIERFNLYGEMEERFTSEEIVEKMRDDIEFEPRTAEVIDRRTGRPTEATIFFTLSYEGKNPKKVQEVASALASFYLELNLKTRERLASNTTVFLEDEMAQLKEQVDLFKEKISEFKRKHLEELPEFNASSLQALSQLNTELDRINVQINSLEERKILLEGQLAIMDPLSPIKTATGETIMNPSERLKYLRMELVSLGSRQSENHPDYRRLKKEIEELDKHSVPQDYINENIKRLEGLEARLAEMDQTMGKKHPDVIELKKQIAALSQEIQDMSEANHIDLEEEAKPDNPAYLNVETQIASADNEILGLIEQKTVIQERIEDYERKLANAPLVEREYTELLFDHEMAKVKYAEITNKLMEARVAQGMESTQRGERFTIIDPAQLPEKPSSPNRLAIMLIGFVLALGMGTGMAAVREAVDNSVKTPDDLAKLGGVPVLSAISLIETSYERRSRRIKIFIWSAVILAAIGIGVLAFHRFVMPLEVFSAKLERKINKMQPI